MVEQAKRGRNKIRDVNKESKWARRSKVSMKCSNNVRAGKTAS